MCMAKARTNVSIDKELLENARQSGIVLSSLLEQALRERLKLVAKQAWEQENSSAIQNYNAEVQASGVFSDGLRSF